MSDLEGEQKKRFEADAEKHADFLYFKIFKPAFVMGFLHGAKHMKDEMEAKSKKKTDKN